MYNVVLINSPVISRETIFYVRSSQVQNESQNLLAEIQLKRSALQKNDRIYATFSSEPWWISIPI